MSINSYKLVPLHDFEKMRECMEIRSNMTNTDDGVIPSRTLKNIIDDNISNDTEFEPSKHFVADGKLHIQRGEGLKTPLFLPEIDVLPKFSKGKRLQDSYDVVTDILEDENLPDDLEIKLYLMEKKKYDRNKELGNMNREKHVENYDKTHADTERFKRIGKVIAEFPTIESRKSVREILNILLKYPEYIIWNNDGDITHPALVTLKLRRMIEIMLYNNKGKKHEIDEVVIVLKPLVKELSPFIFNKKLITAFYSNVEFSRMSKYVSWK